MVEAGTTITKVPAILHTIERKLAGSAAGAPDEVATLFQHLLEALLLVRRYFDQTGNQGAVERRVACYAALCHAEDGVDGVLRALMLEENEHQAAARLPIALAAVQQAWRALR